MTLMRPRQAAGTSGLSSDSVVARSAQDAVVASGLAPGDRLVNNPPAGLMDGETVQPVTPVPGYASAPTSPPGQRPRPESASNEGHASKP